MTREEFKQYVTEVIEILQDPKKSMDYAVEVMFKACDIDKNGLISKQEFQYAIVFIYFLQLQSIMSACIHQRTCGHVGL